MDELEQLRRENAELKQSLAHARNSALEEAALFCDSKRGWTYEPEHCAEDIRAMKTQEPVAHASQYAIETFLSAARVALVSLAHAAEKHGIYQTDHDRFKDAVDKFTAHVSHNIPQPVLTVWEGTMPESNGKSNFTAVLTRKDLSGIESISAGITIARSEYPDRVRYEADRMRFLIGELDQKPFILDYDADKHSGYVYPDEFKNKLKPLSAGLPSPDEHHRVIVFTEGVDFNGEQYFDIKTEDLWENEPLSRTEVADAATHWMELPYPGK